MSNNLGDVFYNAFQYVNLPTIFFLKPVYAIFTKLDFLIATTMFPSYGNLWFQSGYVLPILLDVKLWDDETDMQKLEEAVRGVQMEGLTWGASKLVPVGFGMKKLQIMMTIVDDLVSVDAIIEDKLTRASRIHILSLCRKEKSIQITVVDGWSVDWGTKVCVGVVGLRLLLLVVPVSKWNWKTCVLPSSFFRQSGG
ncbi:elongation factor 1-delta-like protein [Tanacetum coccineum]